MSYRISSYTENARVLRDALLTAEDLDTAEVAAAAIALCEMVTSLEAKVAKLEKAEAGNQRAADVASMLANGIKPD